MASIDIQFYYSHGIIAYINGIEVFRDNMPHGIINHSTLATNSYSYSSYRGIILPAFYAQFNQSVISIELHFTSVNERTIDFNSFISYQSGISTDNPCSVYPHSISASGTFNYLISPSSLPAYVIGSFTIIIPLINSIRLYTEYSSYSPSSLIVSGSDSDSSWTIFTQSGDTYIRYSWKQWSLNSPSQFKSIKFTVNSVQSTSEARITELQFMTCNQDITLSLPQSSYSFFTQQLISLTIDMNGITNCHITPSLPQGLILNRTTCTISGTLTSLSFSSYNITAISHSNTLIRIVSIEIISSLISYPQTNLIIGQGLSFSITPNLTKVSTISIVSGSLPIGLSINPSTGVISGIPSQLLSSQSVTIEAVNGTVIQTVVLSFTVITPISLSHILNHLMFYQEMILFQSFLQSMEINSHSLFHQDLFLLVYHSIHQQESYLERLYLQFLSQISPFKHPIKSDQFNSQSPFKSLFLYPIFIILNSHSLSSKDNHSQSLQSFQETILYSQSLQELFLLVSLSINQLESFLASNELGFIQTQLSFTVNALSTLTIILISLSILIILIILIIIILIILSKKKKHTLPKKSIEEVKSVENRIPNPSHSV
ncbi:hypothetical protein WA171_002108 [Blastocystis sp. BT1]